MKENEHAYEKHETAVKRLRRVVKEPLGEHGLKFSVSGGTVEFDINEFDNNIINNLTIYGLGQKVQDSYAGISDEAEILHQIQKTQKSLIEGKWVTRVPGERKIPVGEIKSHLGKLTEEEAQLVRSLLAKGGLSI